MNGEGGQGIKGMRDRKLEEKLKKLPLRLLRDEFKVSLLSRLRKEQASETIERPRRDLLPALNSALLLLIIALIFILHLSPSPEIVEKASYAPDPFIQAMLQPLYPQEALDFRKGLVRLAGHGSISLKEVRI